MFLLDECKGITNFMVKQMVYIIDDNASVRHALDRLIRSADMEPISCSSVDEFLKLNLQTNDSCVVADVLVPGTSTFRLPELLAERQLNIPVIYITASDTDETRNQAKFSGGSAYFRKPVDDQALLDAISWLSTNHTGSYHQRVL